MIAAERRSKILERVKLDDFVSISNLAREFNVTEMTIRRDLDYLTLEGLIVRSHGGAIKSTKVGKESMFDVKSAERSEVKRALGKKAAELVSEGDCVAIDVGTTTFEVANYIKDINDLTILTASLPVVFDYLEVEHSRVICTGGELSFKDKSLVGKNAIETVRNYILDIAFIGVAGISFDFGYTMFNMHDVQVKEEIIKRSKEVVVVADSSKLNIARHAFFAELEIADKIIIDDGISKDDINRFKELGIEVIVVSKGDNSD